MASIEELYDYYLQHPIICTDTRTIKKDCLFFALKGENFDANTFAFQALQQGAAFAIIDDEVFAEHEKCILVADVLSTLQELAKYHRSKLTIPVIGLTGSNGKTTTKELIRAVLAEKFNTFATTGNLNNHIGVPLSILSITQDAQMAIIEMGANHQNEIAQLCEIAQPTHGLITNVGMAHLDGFGGFEGVKKGKAELFTYLKSHHGDVFINRNNADLMEMSQNTQLEHLISYGDKTDYLVSGKLVNSDPLIALEWTAAGETVHTTANLTGSYNFENILAAICIGHFFGLTATEINHGLSNYFPNNNRSQLTKTANNTVICDFYNANPSSMSAALHNLKSLSSSNKTAILGDMFELGEEAPMQHEQLIKLAQTCGIEQLIFVGKLFYAFKNNYKGDFFNTPLEAAAHLKQAQLKNNLILLKGSRGMALEQLLPLL